MLLNQGGDLLLLPGKEVLVRLPLLGKGHLLLLEDGPLLVQLEVLLLDLGKDGLNGPDHLVLGAGDVPRDHLARGGGGHGDPGGGHRRRGGVRGPLGGDGDGGLQGSAGGRRGGGDGGGLRGDLDVGGRPGGLLGRVGRGRGEDPQVVVELGLRGAAKGEEPAIVEHTGVAPPHRGRVSLDGGRAPGGGG